MTKAGPGRPVKVKPETPKVKSETPTAPISVNTEYMAFVEDDINTILKKYPTLPDIAPLPVSGDKGFQKLTGFGAPFNPDEFDAKVAEVKFTYNCFINFFRLDLRSPLLPYVPMYRERVMEYATTTLKSPTRLKEITLLNSMTHGDQYPTTTFTVISPLELPHALLASFAECIRTDADEAVLLEWIRIILSTQVAIRRMVDTDAQFVEHNSLREDPKPPPGRTGCNDEDTAPHPHARQRKTYLQGSPGHAPLRNRETLPPPRRPGQEVTNRLCARLHSGWAVAPGPGTS